MNANRSDMSELSFHGTGTSGGCPNVMPPRPRLTYHPVFSSPIMPVYTYKALAVRLMLLACAFLLTLKHHSHPDIRRMRPSP
jgi:hypothetical protein